MPGIHFPNAGFRDMDKLWSIPWDAFTLLHFQRGTVPEIRRRYPDATILIRHYVGDWYHADPIAVACEMAQYADELREFNIELTPSNEQNLKCEGHPLGAGDGNPDQVPASVYRDIAAWDSAVAQELRRRVPWCKLHFPALSQGHSDDQNDITNGVGSGYVGFDILRPAVDLYDALDIHTYWEADIRHASWDSAWYGQRYAKPMMLFPGKPVFISECGAHVPSSPNAADQIRRWYDSLPQGIRATLFIWDSDEPNDAWRLHNKPAIVQMLQAYGQPVVPPAPAPTRPPTPSNPSEGEQPVPTTAEDQVKAFPYLRLVRRDLSKPGWDLTAFWQVIQDANDLLYVRAYNADGSPAIGALALNRYPSWDHPDNTISQRLRAIDEHTGTKAGTDFAYNAGLGPNNTPGALIIAMDGNSDRVEGLGAVWSPDGRYKLHTEWWHVFKWNPGPSEPPTGQPGDYATKAELAQLRSDVTAQVIGLQNVIAQAAQQVVDKLTGGAAEGMKDEG